MLTEDSLGFQLSYGCIDCFDLEEPKCLAMLLMRGSYHLLSVWPTDLQSLDHGLFFIARGTVNEVVIECMGGSGRKRLGQMLSA